MAGLPWFKVASDFPGHPKTHRLCVLLGDQNAGMYVIRLLAYCATYAPDGRVPLDMLKQASGWTKQRSSVELLTSSLVQAGFMVCTETHAEIHGWDEWNGAHVRKSAKDNARPNAKGRQPRAGFERGSVGVSSGPRAGEVEGEKRESKKKQLPCTEASSVPAGPEAGSPQRPPQQTTANGAAQAPERAGNGRAAPKPTDPRHHPMQLALVAAFQRARQVKYGFGKQDPRGIAEILALSGGDEIEACRRFEAGLARGAYPRCHSIADLAKHWNAYANGVDAPVKANGGIRGHGRRWWEDLDAEQRGEFMRQRHELAPELDAAPLDVAGEVGRERRDVLALLDRWRAVAERRATA